MQKQSTIKLNKKRGHFMNKEEVLAKAKRENFLGDEREKDIRTKSDAFSLW
ncbi:hypothetical protein CLOSPI_00923 [Thomasclavelia spiroformis DSM 1552]|uniref:Uncharacterized protein n=1 Tax=Thomasclavelia spiroformis DSM 1552 TaxID=428126 RepID=B1C140_9FIRM|nr:hypothetical protein CLOSPI_00923 [Thomasclavelia spiroformis DSM 1552]